MVSQDKVQIIFVDEQKDDAVGIEGSWGNSTYWMFVEEEEFFEFYYDGGQSLVQEETAEEYWTKVQEILNATCQNQIFYLVSDYGQPAAK